MNADYAATMSEEQQAQAERETWPQPKPIRAELRPVPPMPEQLIPAPLRPWVLDITQRMQCPVEFVASSAIVVIGAVVGAGCGIRPKRRDDWKVIPNLWGGVVGPPSLMLKSPTLSETMRPLNRLEAEAHEQHDHAWKSHEAETEMFKARREAIKDDLKKAARGKKSGLDAEAAKDDYTRLEPPKPPSCRRFVTNDATVEKTSEILAENPRGILIFRDELVGLMKSWDREGHESDRAFFLTGWNGENGHTTDRIGRGTIRTERVCLSLLGGIQPAKLQAYLYAAMRGADNDGLVQRLQLMVYPDIPKPAPLVDRYPDSEAKDRAWQIIRTLAEADFLQMGAHVSENVEDIPFFRFDDAAQELFYEWYEELSAKLRNDDEPVIAEHLGKYRSLMPSLALLFHLCDVADGGPGGPVSESAARTAAAWCGFLEEHARRIYGLVSDIRIQAAANLAKHVKAGDLGKVFSSRDVYRKGWALLDDKDVAESACEELIAANWLREFRTEGTIGRPRAIEYHVNPRISQ